MITPPLSVSEVAALGTAAVLAGAVNAIAGGGTLLTFPVLLWFGTGSVVANATNTLALFLGTAGSIVSFRRHIAAVRPWLVWLLPTSAVGGWLGSLLLTHTSERTFAMAVPFLILFATLVFMGQGVLRRLAGFPEQGQPDLQRRMLGLAAVAQLAIAIYGGYFGAGIGILMLASLGLMGMGDLVQMNTVKNILAGVINCVAALWFMASGLIDWPRAVVMTVGAVGGYFLGAHFTQRVSPGQVRVAVVVFGLGVAAVQFWKQYFSA